MARTRGASPLRSVLAAACLLCFAGGCASQSAAQSKPGSPPFHEFSFPLEHSLGPDAPFVVAGTFSGRAYPDKSGSGDVRLSHVKLERLPFSAGDVQAFEALLGDNWLYRVRVPAHVLQPTPGRFAAAFLPARCVVAAGLAESWVLQLDARGGVVALEYAPPGGACPPTAQTPRTPAHWAFKSTVATKLPKEAPLLAAHLEKFDPLTAAVATESGEVPNLQPEGAAEKPLKKTFLQQYGLMIAMLVFNLVVKLVGGGAEKPKEDAAGGDKPRLAGAARKKDA